GQGAKLLRKLRLEGLTCAAIDETGNVLALGTQSGDVHTMGLASGERHTLSLKKPITGLAFSRCGWWFICTADRVHRADLALARHKELLEPDEPPSGCVASPDGSLCAFRRGEDPV